MYAIHCNASMQQLGDRRVLVALAGVAGSGKSTLAKRLEERINGLPSLPSPICKAVGMDGYHYTRQQLDAFEDPVMAHKRRGAHFTFDAEAFGSLLQRLRERPPRRTLAPSFDHAVKDPVEDGVVIEEHHRLVIVEGLYVLLNHPPWSQSVVPQFDCRIFINCPMDVAEERVWRRHVESGICRDEQDARKRWRESDYVNAEFILAHLDPSQVDVLLESTYSQ
mmetsp:Transcript_35013/g.100718  ORF Transcript_35013/g.100718 Transcript_35013/m.100718 type:complete len:222 (-) Transcript_35013:2605-3270(-)